VPRPAFWKQDGRYTCLIFIIATMAQKSKLSNSGSHLTSKMRDGKPLAKEIAKYYFDKRFTPTSVTGLEARNKINFKQK